MTILSIKICYALVKKQSLVCEDSLRQGQGCHHSVGTRSAYIWHLSGRNVGVSSQSITALIARSIWRGTLPTRSCRTFWSEPFHRPTTLGGTVLVSILKVRNLWLEVSVRRTSYLPLLTFYLVDILSNRRFLTIILPPYSVEFSHLWSLFSSKKIPI